MPDLTTLLEVEAQRTVRERFEALWGRYIAALAVNDAAWAEARSFVPGARQRAGAARMRVNKADKALRSFCRDHGIEAP